MQTTKQNPVDQLVKLKVSDKDRKIIKMLIKQHEIDEILFSGPDYRFNYKGDYTRDSGFDYKIVYSDCISGKKHFMLFDKI